MTCREKTSKINQPWTSLVITSWIPTYNTWRFHVTLFPSTPPAICPTKLYSLITNISRVTFRIHIILLATPVPHSYLKYSMRFCHPSVLSIISHSYIITGQRQICLCFDWCIIPTYAFSKNKTKLLGLTNASHGTVNYFCSSSYWFHFHPWWHKQLLRVANTLAWHCNKFYQFQLFDELVKRTYLYYDFCANYMHSTYFHDDNNTQLWS